MEHCSRYWGDGEGCYGVVWVEDGTECWIRNSTTSTAGLVPKPNHYSALIESGDMTPYSETCPNADLSVNKLDGVAGFEYTTHCGKVISGYDDCFSGFPQPCLDSPYSGFFHTETLEECLRICIDQHPLCRAVSFNPGLEIGFANCWPKTGFPETLTDPGPKSGVLHSATITQIDPVDRTCPSDTSYEATGKKNFDIHCGQLNTGTNITSLHTQNVTACIDACATSTDKCVGVLFDSQLTGGFNNCYLQNTTSVITDQTSATYASLSDADAPSSSGSSNNNNNNNNGNSSSPSKAWIAGPVIGGLAALGIIGFAIFWWRRRKAAATHGGVEKHSEHPHGYDAAPAYSPGVHHEHQQGYYDAPASEMDARTTNELPASTKYAHTATAGKTAPQELPS